jgi:hypothetical protein
MELKNLWEGAMKDTLIQFAEINLMGIYVHTNNASRRNSATARKGATIQNLFLKDLSSKYWDEVN